MRFFRLGGSAAGGQRPFRRRGVPRHHLRRPLHADPDFYAFWADGNPDALSISYLYFCNAKGDVFRMPYTMNAEWQKPEPVPGGKPRD